MVKTSKSVKKFAQKHLGAALKHRKKLKPMKQAIRRKQAAYRPDDSAHESEEVAEKKPEANGTGWHDQNKKLDSESSQHKQELNELQQKDPEFYQFLKEHDKELLDFEDEDDEESDGDVDLEDDRDEENETDGPASEIDDGPVTLTTALVEEWCVAVREKQHPAAIRSLLQAFRSACHYGDGEGENMSTKYSIASSHVFNKIMVFVLCEMDGALKHMLASGGPGDKKSQESGTTDLHKSPRWKKVERLVKSYLGNVLHILNQMTDNEMIAFTLRRLKVSVPFLVAFPKLSRRFLKVALHFWGSGEGALPVIALFFIREMAMKLGPDSLDTCLKGMYKEFAANSKFVNPSSLPRIHFRASCVVELYGIDLGASYQLAFVFIRQMAFILRNALTMKTKDAFKSVYNWQYINSLHLWVKVLCTYSGQGDLQLLVYPLAQIIGGVARLVPTARYFPLRLQCVKMLNQLASTTNVFTPVAALLLDMLQFKELHMTPTGGVGKAIDFDTSIKVSKPDIRTRGFQDECVATVMEQLGEHLAQWSYAIAFPELCVVPLLQLRHFLKKTNVDRFRRQAKQLIDQIDRNVQFVGSKRDGVTFSPKDTASVQEFLQAEKETGTSPLSKYLVILRQRAQQRSSNLHKSSEVVGGGGRSRKARKGNDGDDDSDGEDDDKDEDEPDSGDDEEKATQVFSKEWLPKKKSEEEAKEPNVPVKGSKKQRKVDDSDEDDDDIIEDLLISSDDEAEDDANLESDDLEEEPLDVKKKKRGPPKSPGFAGDRSGKKSNFNSHKKTRTEKSEGSGNRFDKKQRTKDQKRPLKGKVKKRNMS